jgi:release factor glutamine methyltransferase
MQYAEIYEPAEDSFLLSDILKREIPRLLSQNKNLKFLEVGSGSGIQLRAAFDSGIKREDIFGADINDNAVKYCKNLGFNCIYSNLFSHIKGKYDLIVFNPPYLPYDKREPESSRVSTTGGKKGSEIINRFLGQAKKHLKKGGKIILLISSLTEGIDFRGYKKKMPANKKIFFENLIVLELSLQHKSLNIP